MRISCPSCQSSYKIADEKVQGRTVKVRCRKCGLMIHVNEHGVANDGGGGGGAPGAQPSTDAAPGTSPQFSVLVSEGDQRDMTLVDVVSAYNSGLVTADTFVWAEGQPDWMPLAQIPEIVEALNAASEAVDAQATDDVSAPAPAVAPHHEPAPPPADFSAPAAQPAARFEPPAPAPALTPSPAPVGGLFGAAAAPAPAPAPQPAPAPTPLFGTTPGAAVREDRRAGNVDLFSKQARAGAEEEIATSAPLMAPDASKPLGARDESSVLFSLSALTSAQASSPSASSADKKDDSGLIDLRALADKDAGPAAPVAAMPAAILDAAPLLGTPIVDPGLHQLRASDPAPAKSNKGMIIGIAFGVGGMLFAGAMAVFALTREPDAPPPVPTTPVDDTATTAAPPPPPTDTGSSAAAPPVTGAPSATAATTKPTGGRPPRPGPAGTKTGPSTTSTSPPTATGKAPPKKSPCGCAPNDLACNMSCAVK